MDPLRQAAPLEQVQRLRHLRDGELDPAERMFPVRNRLDPRNLTPPPVMIGHTAPSDGVIIHRRVGDGMVAETGVDAHFVVRSSVVEGFVDAGWREALAEGECEVHSRVEGAAAEALVPGPGWSGQGEGWYFLGAADLGKEIGDSLWRRAPSDPRTQTI